MGVVRCPKCSAVKAWKLKSGRRRCSACRRTFTPSLVPGMRFRDRRLFRAIIEEFLLGHSSNQIVQRLGVNKVTLLRFLTNLRIAMSRDVPDAFNGVIEVDETYIGGRRVNMRRSQRLRFPTRDGRGTHKQPVFGILCRGGKVWAECLPSVGQEDLQPLIEKRVRKGSTICSDTWWGYTGIAAKGYVHRLVDHSKGQYAAKGGAHINGLEGFWGYLKRRLAAKGGVRKDRLPLYLAEYVWRYNHRKIPLKDQVASAEGLFSTRTGVT